MLAPASGLHKTPTVRDIPSIALTNIESVDDGEFQPYISQVGALYEQLWRVEDSEDEHGQYRDANQINSLRAMKILARLTGSRVSLGQALLRP